MLTTGVSLVLLDSDHFWLASPLPWLREQTNLDVVAEHNGPGRGPRVCAGFLFLNCTPATLELWSKVDSQTKFFRFFQMTKQITEQEVLSRTLNGPKPSIVLPKIFYSPVFRFIGTAL